MWKIKNKSIRLHTIAGKRIVPGKTEDFQSLNASEVAIVIVLQKKDELEIVKSPINNFLNKEEVKEDEEVSAPKKRGRKPKNS